MGRLVSIQDAAGRLGVSVGTLYSWRHRGTGPASFRIGGLVKFDESELERWIAEQAAKAAR